MDFELSEEQRMIQETAYRFAVNEMEPVAKQLDREEKYPRDICRKACETGLVGVFIPEAYGGPELGFLEFALISEQLCRVDLGIATSVLTVTFGSENILMYGTEAQKQEYLPRLINGEAVSAGAYTEPDAGTDVAGTRTRAVRQGDEFVINGNKMFITNGSVCDKALQLHGGYGYIDEYDVQRFYRDAKILEIYEGAKEVEKITIARRLT